MKSARMRIKWLGTASLMVESGPTRILVDPYLRGLNKQLSPMPLKENAAADAALVTHPHFDHFSDIGDFLGAGLKKVFVSESGIRIAKAHGVPTKNMIPLKAGDSFSVGKMGVRVFASRHCVFDAATVLRIAFSPRTFARLGAVRKLYDFKREYPIDNGDVFAFEISSAGKRVMVLGSAGIDENTNYPEGDDLLVFPYQGRARMDRYMQPFLEKFRPRAVMADHFDDAFPPFTHKMDMTRFAPAVKEKLPKALSIVPEEGVWYEI